MDEAGASMNHLLSLTAHNIIDPLRPTAPQEWKAMGDIRHLMKSVYPVEYFVHLDKLLKVLSAVEVASDTDGVSVGPAYHISITKIIGYAPSDVGRCSQDEAEWVLAQFGMEGAEEDNHVPNGKARNFWRPVAEHFVGRECVCKKTEPVVVEGDYEYRPLEIK